MVAKNSLLPMTPRSMWEAIKQLQRDVTELRAARTAEATAIGAGGLRVQNPAEPGSILLTPDGEVRIIPYGGGSATPPAVQFDSGDPSQVTAGAVLTYLADGGGFAIPTLLLITPDVGSGVSEFKLQSQTTAGPAVAQIAVGGAQMLMGTGAFYLFFEDGSEVSIGASGVAFGVDFGALLPLNNGWTATGGNWQGPVFFREVTATVALYGSITPGTLTAGTVIATIPSTGPYIPPADLEFRCAGGSATAYADLVVHGAEAAAPGTITITNVAGTITRLNLSQIRYSL